MKKILQFFLVAIHLLFTISAYSQVPTTQDCLGAIPVCQSSYFQSNSYTGTGNYPTEINSSGGTCLSSGEKNDVWYIFTAITSGQLAFGILPNSSGDDYDWALFNLTNANCSDIYSNNSLEVCCNYSLYDGITGMDNSYNATCDAAAGDDPISPTINVTAGQTYVLNISNYSSTNYGYSLNFGHSTASIFDNVPPTFQSVNTGAITCGTSSISFNFSENILCSTIHACDFQLTGPGGPYTVQSVSGSQCASGAPMENTFTLTFTPPMTQAGTYNIALVTGCGSVTDNCSNTAPANSFNFVNSAPSVSVTPTATTICAGSCTTLVASGATTYSWIPGGMTGTTVSVCPASNTTYSVTGTSTGCTSTASSAVTVTPKTNPTFAAVGPYCSGAAIPALPITSTNGITGTWSPAINNTTTTTYTFTPTAGLCANTTTLTINISNNIIPTFNAVGPYCSGVAIPALPTTSTNGISGTWSPAINNSATTTYTFTPAAGQCANTTTLTITITPKVTPTFTTVGPYCSGAAIPALPTTSNNGITGTWSPAINNAATTTYTFTPTAGLCANTATLTITITPLITPTFTAVGPYCSGAAIPALPTTSNNGITGTWSPAINNTTTTNYTFTPTAGLCATTATMTIVISTNITPTFTALGPYCSGASFGPLPTTSTNGIIGTWSPAINNTATTTYTFTPNAGQCATSATMTITVNPNITPTFAAMGPYCPSTSFGPLPTTSTNGISGTWSPAINNTATTTYTFTPSAGQCATTATMTITINSNITPTFTAMGPYCSGASFGPLPSTSLNGITGTWSPAINNTATTTYTFTPTVGLCATSTTMTITINSNITPTFTAVGPYCSGAAIPALPTTSNNGITGTWSPAINNTATTTYTFTPTAGLCATTTTMTIVVNPNTTPTFTAIGPFCSGASFGPLPTTSTNGITGTWNPAINNTATTTYTFTPTAGLCATITTMTIVVDPNITPTFTALGPYCSGASIGPLPTTSTNGITGTWSPAVDNTTTTTYTFTPTAGLCATTTTMTIVISTNITPIFTALGPYCSGASFGPLPTTSLNGITGIWSPAINNTATTTYTFTPTVGQCAISTTMTITVDPNINPTFATMGPFCSGAAFGPLPTTSTNGITGTWSPAINNTATTTYTFTPTAGLCATSTTMTIVIDPNITPTFTALGPYCSGASIGALPTTSTNGITGTWSPAINNTATTTYTFTPTAGLCATTTTMTIVIDPNITPTFTALGPYCSGASIGPLPTTSTNGITGTWSPAVDNTTTTNYTFTPTAGLCATTTTMTIAISTNITPIFTTLGPYCSGASFGPLPTTSANGITGTWNPAINNTATTTYTFTPTVGLCATTTTMTIVIDPNITPTFTVLGPYCSGASFGPLPTTSTNGITGTWSPAINNTATTTYTFTPTAGLCATSATMTIVIDPNITPTFTALGPYCSGASFGPLPTTSTNGITGTWSPAINNTATTTYTFTPTVGLCATTTTMTIVIDQNITPTFTVLGPYCSGASFGPLPTTSINGITGTWSPAINNTATTTYTFTPTAGLCATNTIMTIAVNSNTTPTFATIGPYCSGAVFGPLPTTSLNGVTGNWSPAINNTGTTTYTFTPTAGQCATNQTLNIVINLNPTVNAGADTAIGSCSYSNYVMNPTPTGTIATWNWTGAGISPTNTQNPTAHPIIATTYIVTVTDNNGCTASDNIFINVRPLPTATAGADVSIGTCPLSDTTLYGIGTGAGPLSYTWSPSAGITPIPPSGQNVLAKPNITTTYILTVTDRFGCTAIDNIIVTVNPLPTAEAGNNDTIGSCASSSITLHGTGTGTGTLGYSWSPTAGLTTPNNQNTIAKPSTTTTYQLTVRDVYGCTAADNVIITVNIFSVDAGPNADRGSCNTSTAILNGSPTGIGPYSGIIWTPTNGLSTTITYSPVTATPNVTTTYTLTMTDAFGCTANDNVVVTVHPLPNVDAGYNDSIGSCAGSTVTLNGNATGSSPFVYLWSPPGGLSNTNIYNPIAKPNATAIYTLTVTDTYSCSASDNVTITVKPLPTTIAGADTTIGYCNTSVALLSGTGTGTATLNYSWTPTSGITSVNSPVTNAKPSVTTTYVLTITDRFGCTATDNVTVNISAVTADAGNDIALGTCAGSNGQMNASATGTGPFTFNWSPPTGLNQTNIPNPTAQPGVTTNYSVVVTDFFGCSATDAMVASVNIFDETVLHFTMTPDQGCQPLTTTFEFTPNNEIVPDSWLWDFGDNSSTNHTSTEINPVYTFANVGNYIVTLTVTSIYGCTVSYSDTVKVSRKPIAAFINHPEVGSSDNPRIEFFDQSSYASHWLWNFGDPASGVDNSSNTKDAVHIFSDTGLFKVILIVSNAEGCSDTAERYISIYQDFAFFIPNAITPNEDEDNEVFLPQGVGFRTQGYLMLIFDRWGKQLFKNENVYKGWDAISPNGNPYPQGVYTYLITVFEESGKKHIFKGVVTVVSPDHN